MRAAFSLGARPYEEQFFADYIAIVNRAFSQLRVAAGLVPDVFPTATLTDGAVRRHTLHKKENIYVVFEGSKAVGVAEIDGTSIETVAVAPEFQGMGYGKRITQFSVNRLKERNLDRISLCVGEPNLRARQLYQSLGFTLVQVMAISRLDR